MSNQKNYDEVQSPKHYTDTKIEVIDYIEDKNLGFCLGNAIDKNVLIHLLKAIVQQYFE